MKLRSLVENPPPSEPPRHPLATLLVLVAAGMALVGIAVATWWNSDARVNRRAVMAQYYCLDHPPIATCLQVVYGWNSAEANGAALAYLVYRQTGNGWPVLPRP